ncbi:hypothetical protein Brsp07_04534 [Brucella sp. NBRC 14130]|uniref:hypothetical protein n=1 Tax=Brucella sp. NBRC 14130 TaxID=3075483 RepID=UPI003095384E
MMMKRDYDELIAALARIEKTTGLYLTDTNVDIENVTDGGVNESDPEYWSHMYSAACMAAGLRAEEAKQDINALIGYIIY